MFGEVARSLSAPFRPNRQPARQGRPLRTSLHGTAFRAMPPRSGYGIPKAHGLRQVQDSVLVSPKGPTGGIKKRATHFRAALGVFILNSS